MRCIRVARQKSTKQTNYFFRKNDRISKQNLVRVTSRPSPWSPSSFSVYSSVSDESSSTANDRDVRITMGFNLVLFRLTDAVALPGLRDF